MTIEELIDQYGDDILRLCLLYMGDRQLAEDAFQETFVKAWKRLGTFRGESGVKTWLSHIAANTCRDMLRTGWLRMLRKSRSVEEMRSLPAPRQEQSHELTDAVRALPGPYREVIVLYYYQNMKLKEMSELLRLPVSSISTRLRRARARLAQALKGDENA